MKKLRNIIIMLLLLVYMSSMSNASPNLQAISGLLKEVSFQLNSVNQTSTPVIFFQDRIYVPLRFVVENLQGSTQWDEKNNRVQIEVPKAYEDFKETDPWLGERFVYGEVLSIDRKKYTLTIEEHIDDHTIYTEPNITVSKDVIIILQRNKKKMNVDFEDLRVGENIGLVINKEGIARGIILND